MSPRRGIAACLVAAGLLAAGAVAAGPAAAADTPCPGARPTTAAQRTALVSLVVPPRLAGRPPVRAGSTSDLLRRALLNVDRHALTTLYTEIPAGRGAPPDDPRSSGAEALALAATLATGAYDEGLAGHPRARALDVATWLVGANACGHAAVTPGGWGAAGGDAPLPVDLHGWLSPLAAVHAGTAGWLLWPQLGELDRYRVAAMVVAEADLLLRTPPGYQVRADGRVLHPGDSKSEEDAWMTGVLGLASAMLPGHPHARAWRAREAAWQVAAFATARDAASAAVVNGRPLRWWLAGWNAAADGTVTNHHIAPHPDYMAMASLNLFAAAADTLAGRATLRTAVHGTRPVYRSLVAKSYPSPPYAAPGGTIYRAGSGRVYYPRASDWGTGLTAHFAGVDAAAAALGLDPSARAFLRLHTQALLAQQARGTDGRTFQAWAEFRYPQREQWVAEQLARAWIVEWAAGGGTKTLPVTDASVWGAARLP